MLTTSKTCPLTPEEAKALAEQLTTNFSGNMLHKEFDQASNNLLISLGYSEFVNTFKKATEGYHD